MTGNFKRIILILSVAVAHVLFFQNCSKIAFENTDALAEKSGVEASGFEPNDAIDNQDDSEDLADSDSDIDGVAPGENSPDLADGSFPESDLDGDADNSSAEEAACASFRADALTSFDFTLNDEVVRIRKMRGDILVLSAEVLKAKNIRGSLYVRAPLSGNTSLINNKNSKIKNVRGPVCVVASGSGKLKALKNHRGYADLSNMSHVRQIRNLRGKLVIRNSTVDRIINHRGPIVLINSRVERIRNQRGSITLLGSSTVGKMKNIRP